MAMMVALQPDLPPVGQAVFRGVTPEAFLVHPQIRLVEGRVFNPGGDEVIVGALTATRLGIPPGDLAVAVATGAHFVRCNVHVGAAVTDQGPLTGEAWRTLRRRRELGADVGILADVRVKHARPLVERPLVEEAADLRLRGLADAIIVTGPATGAAADPDDLAALRAALPDCPLLVGSGVTADTVASFVPAADGVIIGSSLQSGGRISAERTAVFRTALDAALGGTP